MQLLARFGRNRCHVCGELAESINYYDTGGCWHGQTATLQIVPLCREHSMGNKKPPGVIYGCCGGDCGPGTPGERSQQVERELDRMFPDTAKQLTML